MSDGQQAGSPDGQRAHPFFPLVPGSAWSYTTRQDHATGELAGVASTLTVRSLRREPGRLVAEVVDRVEPAGQESAYEIVAALDGILPGVGRMRVGELELTSADPSGLYLPFALGLDHAWSYGVTYLSPVSRTVVRGSMRAVAEAELSTPAGRFRVLHLCGELRTELTSAGIAGRPVVQVQHEDHFYARGVGLVRAVTWTGSGYSSVKELTAYRR